MQAILHATQIEAEQSRQVAAQTRQLTEEMTKILQSTQEETAMSRRVAVQSQRLSEEMMKDSVAMKTVNLAPQYPFLPSLNGADNVFQVAVLTAFFLPGTSFAVSRQKT